MTKEEILAMEAGRESDAIIAEVIFRKSIVWNKNYPQVKLGGALFGAVPSFFTAIKFAWQVVDKMFELGYSMSLLHLGSEFYPEYWYCDFRSKDSNKPPEYEWVDHQKTAPVAICKAALLAKLKEKMVE